MPAELEWYDIVVRLLVASALGAVIGIEREFSGQDAGFRTHLMLSLGAAAFGVVSVGAFDRFVTAEATNVQVDVTRIASYVAAGVGFIGGGVILKHAGTVRGITTATSLWVAAAVGLSAGVGLWEAAVASSVVAIVALAALKPLSDWIDRRSHLPKTIVVLVRRSAKGVDALAILQDTIGTSIKSAQIGESHEGDQTEVVVQLWSRPEDGEVRKISERLDAELGGDVTSVTVHN